MGFTWASGIRWALQQRWLATSRSLEVNLPYQMISVIRDVNERGRDLDQILYQYTTFVKPAFEEFCLPVRLLKD